MAVFSDAEFAEIFRLVDNSDVWGADDEKGTLNYIAPHHVMRAASLVAVGRSVSMARPIDVEAAVDHTRPALHYMSKLADFQTGEPTGNYDFFGFECHGWNITHVDALCHTAYNGRLYNGVANRVTVTADGAKTQSILAMKDGIVGRGVLLDVARAAGVEWLEPGTEITTAMLERAEVAANLRVEEGDIVVYRSGATRRRRELGPWDLELASAGLHPRCVEWFHTRRIGALCSDGAHDVRPQVMSKIASPIHALTIAGMGLCTIDALDLEAVSAECVTNERWEFLFAALPLVIPGATGSPVNPVAVF